MVGIDRINGALMSGKVYIANCGERIALWPVTKANSTLITVDNLSIHPFWQRGGSISLRVDHMNNQLQCLGVAGEVTC